MNSGISVGPNSPSQTVFSIAYMVCMSDQHDCSHSKWHHNLFSRSAAPVSEDGQEFESCSSSFFTFLSL